MSQSPNRNTRYVAAGQGSTLGPRHKPTSGFRRLQVSTFQSQIKSNGSSPETNRNRTGKTTHTDWSQRHEFVLGTYATSQQQLVFDQPAASGLEGHQHHHHGHNLGFNCSPPFCNCFLLSVRRGIRMRLGVWCLGVWCLEGAANVAGHAQPGCLHAWLHCVALCLLNCSSGGLCDCVVGGW